MRVDLPFVSFFICLSFSFVECIACMCSYASMFTLYLVSNVFQLHHKQLDHNAFTNRTKTNLLQMKFQFYCYFIK